MAVIARSPSPSPSLLLTDARSTNWLVANRAPRAMMLANRACVTMSVKQDSMDPVHSAQRQSYVSVTLVATASSRPSRSRPPPTGPHPQCLST